MFCEVLEPGAWPEKTCLRGALRHLALPEDMTAETLSCAGLLLTIDDGEPRTMLDFDEEHHGETAGWHGSSRHGRFQAAVRLPMALHNGWLQTQVRGALQCVNRVCHFNLLVWHMHICEHVVLLRA